TLLNPTPSGRVGDMHELHRHRAAIELASSGCMFTFQLQLGLRLRLQEAQRVQTGLQIAPAAKGVKDKLPLRARQRGFRSCSNGSIHEVNIPLCQSIQQGTVWKTACL